MLSKLIKLFKSGPDSTADTAPAKPVGSAPIPRSQFADAYVVFVRRHAPELTVEREDQGVSLAWADGGSMSQYLNNAYANYRNDPDALTAIFHAELAAARQTANSVDAKQGLDLALVLPVVKTEDWLASVVRQRGADQDRNKDLVVQPLTAGLIVVYAQDLPDSIEYVKRGDLVEGVDEATLSARARTNLEARVPAMTINGADGRYRIELDGFFDVSLMLIVASWVGQLDLTGDPVFALPCRDQLMVCGSLNREAVSELAEIAPHIAADSSYQITNQLLVLRDGQLQVL
jgi:hypothetical protein